MVPGWLTVPAAWPRLHGPGCLGPAAMGPAVWARLFGPGRLGPAVWARLFGPGCMGPAAWGCLGPAVWARPAGCMGPLWLRSPACCCGCWRLTRCHQVGPGALQDVAERGQDLHRQSLRSAQHKTVDLGGGQVDAAALRQRNQLGGRSGEHPLPGHHLPAAAKNNRPCDDLALHASRPAPVARAAAI